MEQPVYVRRLLEQKWLLIVGLIIAVIAGLVAGFTIQNGQIVSRTVQTYTASSTVLLTSSNPTYFVTQIPAVTTEVPVGTAPTSQPMIVTPGQVIDPTGSAIILAYIASSDMITQAVVDQIGPLADGEMITAVRRTTQPSGDETFPGRLQLPIIDIAGVAESPARAELISSTATAAFTDYVAQQQVDQNVADADRLALDELNAPVAGEGVGSNPAIPIIVVAVGVLLVFIALALIIGAVRDRRRARAAAAPAEASDEPELPDDPDDSIGSLVDDEPSMEGVTVPAGPFVRRRVRSAAPAELPVEVPTPTHS
jgi:hypothetical protein